MNKFIIFLLLAIILLSGCDFLPEIPTPTTLPKTATPPPTQTATATIVWFPPTFTPTHLPTAGVTPTPKQIPELGELIFDDPLSTNSSWQTARSEAGGVAFGNDELTVAVAKPKGYVYSFRDAPLLKDFYLEINSSTSLCREFDSYGIVFRAQSSRNYYRFVISCAGMVWMERENGGYTINLSSKIQSGQAHPGPTNVLRLGVMARGKEYRFFINDVFQFTASDPSFPQGMLGVFARSGGDTAVTVSFKDLVVNNLR